MAKYAASRGVVITMGLVCGSDRAALVFPALSKGVDFTAKTLCKQAVQATEQGLVAQVAALMNQKSYVAFVQAVGMVSGNWPYRVDYASTAHPGTGGANAIEASMGGLVTFYPDPEDYAPGARLHHSRMVVPGIAPTDLNTDGSIASAYYSKLEIVATAMIDGWAGESPSTVAFARAIRAAGPAETPETEIPCVAGYGIRYYTGTQRRRITPH